MRTARMAFAAVALLAAVLPARAAAQAAHDDEAVVGYIGKTPILESELLAKIPAQTRQSIDRVWRSARQGAAVKKLLAPQAKKRGMTVDELIEAESKDFTEKELGKSVAIKTRQQIYQARRRALDQIVGDRLMAKEAEKRGISVAELRKAEIEDKIAPPTDSEIEAYYKANKNRIQSLMGKTLEQATPTVKSMLRRQKVGEQTGTYVKELKVDASVRVLLVPPRVKVPVPAGEPSRGPTKAPVTMVEFSDFQCGFCKRVEPTVDRLLDEYGDKLRLVFRDYPLSNHKRARPAAIAARCAGDQGKYWDYHADLMKVSGSLSDDDLKKRAERLGLDMDDFAGCLETGPHADAVDASVKDAVAIGVSSTPTFFINGRPLIGAKPYEAFKEVIDEELENAGARPKRSKSSRTRR